MELKIPEFNGTLKWPKSYLIYLVAIVTTTKAVSYDPRDEATQSNPSSQTISGNQKCQDMSRKFYQILFSFYQFFYWMQ